MDGLFEFKNYNSNQSGNQRAGKKGDTSTDVGGRSPRFNEGRYTRKRASISSLQDAQRKSEDMQDQENEGVIQAQSSKKSTNAGNDPKAPLTSHK